MDTNTKVFAMFGAAALMLAGCSGEPTQTQTNFGASVRQMVEAQTANPSTIANPSATTIAGTDAKRVEAVLEAYRTDVAKPEAVNDNVTINLDNAR